MHAIWAQSVEDSPQAIVDALPQDDLVPIPGSCHGRMH